MWKDFFYFSKSERRAILFLLTLLFIFMCIWVLFPVKEESLEQDQEGIEEIKNFLAGVHEMEEKESLQYSYDKPKRIEVVLAAFDPNSADSIEFLQCGLPPFIAHTILYNPQIQISAESGTKRSIFRQKNKTKRSKNRLHTTLIKPEQKVNEDLCSGFVLS